MCSSSVNANGSEVKAGLDSNFICTRLIPTRSPRLIAQLHDPDISSCEGSPELSGTPSAIRHAESAPMPENVWGYQGDLDLNISKVSTIKQSLRRFVSDANEEQVESSAAPE